MRIETLKKLIEQHLPESTAYIASDDEVHFNAEVVSSFFEGKSLVQQSRLVYDILDPYIKTGEIHAISLKTRLK